MEQIDVGLENWAANLAARLQLDSPAPSRPPLVSSGASSSSADAALGQAPTQFAASLELLQELQRGLHQAGLGRSDVPRDDWMAAFQGDQGSDSKQAQLQTELQEATLTL